MARWTRPGATPLEDMRIPLSTRTDIERIEACVSRAREMGLRIMTFVVPDTAPTPWLPAVVAAVRRARAADAPEIRIALEGRIVSDEGHISVAALPPGVDALYITLDTLPMGMVCVSALELREAFEEGRTSAMSIVRRAVEVLQAAMRRNPGIVLSRPFALLSAVGIPEEWVSAEAMLTLAREASRTGASLQIDEWERSPRAGTADAFVNAGVPVLFGSGARTADDVGVYEYIGSLVRRVPGLAEDLLGRQRGAAFDPSITAFSP